MTDPSCNQADECKSGESKARPDPRLDRERRTVHAMIRLYCRDHHKDKTPLCADCTELWDYVQHRLNRCPFHEEKPTCAKCPVHCYQPAFRERIRTVMRYAGPRMLRRHPILALHHLLDGFRKPPASIKRDTKQS